MSPPLESVRMWRAGEALCMHGTTSSYAVDPAGEYVVGMVLAGGSEFPDAGIVAPRTIGGTATVLQINTDDVDALWAQAIAAGAEVRHELADAFWGERHGQLTDPFGHRWNVAKRIRDVPHDELVAAAAQALGGS